MKWKLIRKLLGWLMLVFVFMLLVLAGHIYMVTEPSKDQLNWKVTLVEFTNVPLDSATSVKARAIISSIPEVLDSYLNAKDGTLAYSTRFGSGHDMQVYEQLISQGNFNAQMFKSEKKNGVSGGCPVNIKESPSMKLYSYLKDLF